MFILVSLTGCDENPNETTENSIIKIEIYSLPDSYTNKRIYTNSNKISAISTYLAGLNLQSDFPENPNEYRGMAFIITITYEDGTEVVYN